MNARYTDPENTMISWQGMSVPAVPGNRHYDELIEQGITIEPYVPPAPTVMDVKVEAARRILSFLPEYKQRNITARGVELLRIGELNWTAEQKAEADAIQASWDHIKAIRIASDEIEALNPIPADYDADARWP